MLHAVNWDIIYNCLCKVTRLLEKEFGIQIIRAIWILNSGIRTPTLLKFDQVLECQDIVLDGWINLDITISRIWFGQDESGDFRGHSSSPEVRHDRDGPRPGQGVYQQLVGRRLQQSCRKHSSYSPRCKFYASGSQLVLRGLKLLPSKNEIYQHTLGIRKSNMFRIQKQWGSENRTCPVFEWSTLVRFLNGPVFEWSAII